jgi:uncharacterized protein YyaL (SSP411 family)
MRNKTDGFHHTYKNGQAKYPAFLDDYAFLVASLIGLQEITGEDSYLYNGRTLIELVLENFGDEGDGMFYYTHKDQTDIIVRKKEIFDGAVPSGNSVMAWNLYYLGVIFDKIEWREKSFGMCALISPTIKRYPTSFGFWATLIQGMTYGIPEIAILGKDIRHANKEFLRTFIPLRIFQSTTRENDNFPLLYQKPIAEEPNIFLCKHYSCQNPVTEVNALIRLLEIV